VTGSVKDMNLVSTLFKTPDNQNIIVPNGQIWGGTITNVTANDTRRVDLVAGIGYGDDVEKAEKVLEDIVTSHPLVLKDPAPVIKLHELADSSVNFVVRPWSKTSDYWTVYWDLTRQRRHPSGCRRFRLCCRPPDAFGSEPGTVWQSASRAPRLPPR
jgi:small conductance mechanosensitive channel